MTDRDLRKMNRKELLELLIASEKENERLNLLVQQQEAQLQNVEITAEKTGSIAEAALVLNGIFQSADKAATQYLDNIKRRSEQQENICEKLISEAEQKAKEIIDNAEIERQIRIGEADEYWKDLSTKLEAFYQDHPGLREMISDQSVRGKAHE